MPDDTLVVPVEVAALAVNAQTRDGDGSYVMHRWSANFRNLSPTTPPPSRRRSPSRDLDREP